MVVRENMTAVMVDRLVADIVSFALSTRMLQSLTIPFPQLEVVEGLVETDSPVHALNALKSRKTVEGHHGRLEEGSGSKSNGTYARQC